LNTCGRNITHSPTLLQTRLGDMIHSSGECELREKHCAIYPAKNAGRAFARDQGKHPR
jgi:Cu/Zn superoxide dismutase